MADDGWSLFLGGQAQLDASLLIGNLEAHDIRKGSLALLSTNQRETRPRQRNTIACNAGEKRPRLQEAEPGLRLIRRNVKPGRATGRRAGLHSPRHR